MAKEKSTGKLVAIKVMYKDELKKNNVVNQVRREVEIHAKLRHENIIRFYSHFMDPERGEFYLSMYSTWSLTRH